MEGNVQCLVCLQQIPQTQKVQLKCGHIFCKKCVTKFIQTLRMYNQLRPEKLSCLAENCYEEIDDAVITQLFPGELGFIFKIIRKRYKQLGDPNIVIFDCKGYVNADRKPLIPKPEQTTRQKHSTVLNELSLKIQEGIQKIESAKTCKNIFSHNKTIPRKQKTVVCITCGCSYCVNCLALGHEGGCPKRSQKIDPQTQSINKKLDPESNDFQKFLETNKILTCLNPKCQVAIAKQQGCFWIKCRCSYQMCYPCKKLWGDCEHFAKYPYGKFVPPPQWMVKALNLY